jgi:nicotinamidase/pyrazinamidase
VTTVFFDIDTQVDFCFPSGALYARGAERILENVAALNRYAAANGIPVISTMDAHAENDPEFREWPHHCVAGTLGQHKVASTLLEKRVVIPNARGALEISGAQQVLLEKQNVDCFTCVNLPALLDAFAAERCVVYGVVTEVCVQLAASGLLRAGKRVEIVTDAIQSLDDANGSRALADLAAAGATLRTLAQTVPLS